MIHIQGHTTDLNEEVKSMQIEHDVVESAKKGDSIGTVSYTHLTLPTICSV